MGIIIQGVGGYLPERVVSNTALPASLDTSDEWIFTRTGIRARHLADPRETTADMATRALERALAHAGVYAKELDLLIVATTTPDQAFPAVAVRVQTRVGMTSGFAFDLQAVCSGFLYALDVARSLMLAHGYQTAAVIGADLMSRLLDWTDRSTCVLFGDGAGAVILKAIPGDKGLRAAYLASDGGGGDLLQTVHRGSHQVVAMNGREVYREAIGRMIEAIEAVLAQQNVMLEMVDWIVPHQANARIVEAVMKRLNFPMEKVILSLDQQANTSAASVPLALTAGVERGQLCPGQRVVLVTMGAGFTWGASLVDWTV